MKNAQGAIEYLLIIAAAIIVVAIVVVAISGITTSSNLDKSTDTVGSALDTLKGQIGGTPTVNCGSFVGELSCSTHLECTYVYDWGCRFTESDPPCRGTTVSKEEYCAATTPEECAGSPSYCMWDSSAGECMPLPCYYWPSGSCPIGCISGNCTIYPEATCGDPHPYEDCAWINLGTGNCVPAQ